MSGRSQFARSFGPVYEAVRSDIFKFAALLNFKITWQQAEVLALVQQRHKRIAVKSGMGLGKTSVSVIVALWRTLQFADTLTIVTAPTMRQCKGVWLTECRRVLERADPVLRKFIECTKSSVVVAGRPDWGIRLITATKEENAQGLHQNNLTVIMEEASGIKREIVGSFEGTVTNENALLMQIGNPNTRDCAFFDAFNRDRHRWATLTLNTEDAAQIVVERDGRLEPMVSPENIQYLADKHGRDSDYYRIRVLGEFPQSDPNCVMSSEDVDACTRTSLVDCAKAAPARQIGIDFARFGADESVVMRRKGNAVVEWAHFAKTEPADVARYAFKLQSEADWRDRDCWYVPDAGGMGQGVMHVFREARKQVHEFHSNGRPAKKDYDNKITEAWFGLADLVKRRKAHLPNDPRLVQQLSTRQYHVTKQGKLALESKDDYKRRSTDEEGASPDRADAAVMAFYERVQAAGNFTERTRPERPGLRVKLA